MNEITENEMKFVLGLFKNPKMEYNARSIAKLMGISHMGVMKIAKRMEKEGIVSSRLVGKARIYRLNLEEDYVYQYVLFLLKREAKRSAPHLRVWINNLKEIKHAQGIILFGSVITKYDKANDIDALIIVDEKNFKEANKEIEKVNSRSPKRIHPVFQTKEDLRNNIKKEDKVILNAIRGIAVSGEKTIIEAIK